jgi:hypothetical protein
MNHALSSTLSAAAPSFPGAGIPFAYARAQRPILAVGDLEFTE